MSLYLEEARRLAASHAWTEVDFQEANRVVIFKRGTARINVYYTRGTVATVVDHPRYGRNQMFRRNVWGDALKAIFINPRAHLNQEGIPGYHMAGRHISHFARKKRRPT